MPCSWLVGDLRAHGGGGQSESDCMNILGSRAQKADRRKITGALEGHRRGPWVEYIARTESLFPPSGSISYSLASIRPHLHLWMLVLLPCCLQTSALPSVEAMEGPLS